jgi:hypothetical protein
MKFVYFNSDNILIYFLILIFLLIFYLITNVFGGEIGVYFLSIFISFSSSSIIFLITKCSPTLIPRVF